MEEVLVRVVLEEAENQWRSLSLYPLSVSPFVVWFLWNNLIKVAGWLNSEWKLGYICLSFPLKSSFPPSDAPSSSHFHQLSLFERGKLPLSHYFHNYFSGCQEIRPNHNQKRGKCCMIGFWSANVSSFKHELKDLISFPAAFQRPLSSAGFLT